MIIFKLLLLVLMVVFAIITAISFREKRESFLQNLSFTVTWVVVLIGLVLSEGSTIFYFMIALPILTLGTLLVTIHYYKKTYNLKEGYNSKFFWDSSYSSKLSAALLVVTFMMYSKYFGEMGR